MEVDWGSAESFVEPAPVSDVPVPLTTDQIEHICSQLKLRWNGEHTKIEQTILQKHRANLFKALTGKAVKPSKVQALEDAIVSKFYKGLITPGSAEGVIAAQSICEPVTQGTLNTFHSTGQSAKNVTLGFPRAQELFNTTENPSNPTCMVYFKHHNTAVASLHSLTDKFCSVIIEDLLESFTVISPTDYKIDWWQRTFLELFPKPDPDDPDATIRDRMPDSYWCLRLKFNLKKLYTHKITTRKIAEDISAQYADLLTLWSPLALGTVEIWADCTNINQIEGERTPDLEDFDDRNSDDCRRFYMTSIVTPKIRGRSAGGIPGIRKLYPRKVKSNTYGVLLRPEFTAKLAKQPTDAEEWIIDTDGTNLAKLLQMPGVDTTRTYSNDIWEIINIFGIEAARTYLIMEFTNIIASTGSWINPAHVKILVDKMTYTGDLRNVTRHGVEESEYGPLTRASFEEVLNNLVLGSLNSETETLNGISSNVALGKQIAAGTGRVHLRVIPMMASTIASKRSSNRGSRDSNGQSQQSHPHSYVPRTTVPFGQWGKS